MKRKQIIIINSKYCLMNKDLNYNYIEDDWNNFLQPGYHYYYVKIKLISAIVITTVIYIVKQLISL